MARIAITGGSGFIGKHLIPQLIAEGHQIRTATRAKPLDAAKGFEIFHIDLVTASDVALRSFLHGCEILIHLAGEISDQTRMRALHVDATSRLAKAATMTNIMHWIQLSSCGVYGPNHSRTVVEDSPKAPVGEYEVTKWEAEEIASGWAISSGRKVTVLRPSIIWSSTMPNNSLRSLISIVRQRLFFFIGPPGSIYPCVHVDDLITAVSKTIDRPGGNIAIFNLSDNVTLEKLITAIADVTDKPSPRIRIPERVARAIASAIQFFPTQPLTQRKIDVLTSRTEYCSDAACSLLGWRPQKNLRDGLVEFIDVVDAGDVEQ
jgi:nucleoside-diphosphate-sugar epimerase